MGYCTYTKSPTTGDAVAAWIGTGTDAGKQKTITYRKGTLGANNKSAACNDVKKQFCQLYGNVHCVGGINLCNGSICSCSKTCDSAHVLDRVNCLCVPKVTSGNCTGNCWKGIVGPLADQTATVCGSSCNDARNKFCAQYGKSCPGGKKCYGANGQDPCPSSSGIECDGTDPSTWGKCIGDWFSGACHAFDFLPGGGCNQYTQIALLLGGVAVVIMILKR